MKKLVVVTALALAATAASALEIGVTAVRDYSTTNRNAVGVTLGHNYGNVGVDVGLASTTVGDNNQSRVSLVGSYDAFKIGNVTVAATAGVAYLDNQNGPDGYATTLGFGTKYPLTKTLSLTADVSRQYGQTRVDQFNGNRVAFGFKQTF